MIWRIGVFHLMFLVAQVHAQPVLSRIDWLPACDGSLIEVIKDEGKILSVHAGAMHASSMVEWTILYLGGRPISAEYREFARGRISSGEKVGEYSGDNQLKRIETWKAEEGRLVISDEVLKEQLADILTKASGG